MLEALRSHWPEYVIEGALLGAFMVSACVCVVGIEHPGSPIRRALPRALVRRALIGLAMGVTAATLIYSPWGARSGAHMNPAVTATFWRLGRIGGWDAAFYMAAQVAGGALGVVIARVALGRAVAHPEVAYAVTAPGRHGAGAAFVAEFVISFILMFVVLAAGNTPEIAPFTGLFAGLLVAAFITFEAPLSGMSINPARTLASAVPARRYRALWVYLLAPPAAMLAAGAVYARGEAAAMVRCAKINHLGEHRCIFHCAVAALTEAAGGEPPEDEHTPERPGIQPGGAPAR